VTACEICGDIPERHHIVSRGSGGVNEDFNILHLCRVHHVEFHNSGRVSFANRYPFLEYRIRKACEKQGKRYNKDD